MFKINGHIIYIIRYADNTVLIYGIEMALQELLDNLKDENEQKGLKNNIKTNNLFSKKNTVLGWWITGTG